MKTYGKARYSRAGQREYQRGQPQNTRHTIYLFSGLFVCMLEGEGGGEAPLGSEWYARGGGVSRSSGERVRVAASAAVSTAEEEPGLSGPLRPAR